MSSSEIDLRELLIQNSGPALYEKNGFRVLELPVTSSARDIARRRSTVDKALTNALPVPAGRGRALPVRAGSELHDVVLSAHRLGSPSQRILDEVFWFWPRDDSDAAMVKLKDGLDQEAELIWLDREDTDENRSVACHNLAVYYHLRALEAEQAAEVANIEALTKLWEKSYRRWARIVADSTIWTRMEGRVKEIDDPRLSPEIAEQIRSGVAALVATTTAILAIQAVDQKRFDQAKRLMKALRGSDLRLEDVLQGIGHAVVPMRSRLTTMCKAAEKDAESNPIRADESCRRLIDNGLGIIEAIDCLSEPQDASRMAAHDELADTIRRCEIVYTNKTCDWAQGIEFLKAAARIVASPTIKARIEKDIKTDENGLDRRDDYCGAGYYQAPKEVLDRLESAREHLGTRNYDQTVTQLTKFLKEQFKLICDSQALPIVRKALAYSLGMRGLDKRGRAIAEYNKALKDYQRDLLRQAASNRSSLFNYVASTGGLTCNVCGTGIYGSYRRVKIEGIELVLCLNHTSPSESSVNNAIKQTTQDYVDALFLDPTNKFIVEAHAKIKAECAKEGISFPAVSAWITALIPRNERATRPQRSTPITTPSSRSPVGSAMARSRMSPEMRLLVWVCAFIGSGPLGLIAAHFLVKWGDRIMASGKSMRPFWVTSGMVFAVAPLILLYILVFGGH